MRCNDEIHGITDSDNLQKGRFDARILLGEDAHDSGSQPAGQKDVERSAAAPGCHSIAQWADSADEARPAAHSVTKTTSFPAPRYLSDTPSAKQKKAY